MYYDYLKKLRYLAEKPDVKVSKIDCLSKIFASKFKKIYIR